MKQLTCEMCGSTELMKQDGVFVCQSCGTKYSVEEAKKMMVEGTVEVTGTVKVDDTAKMDNYYFMAESAYDAGNKREAENYCNKIIEVKPKDYKAWFLKGRAAGWQSTVANPRIEEAANCFNKAIEYAPKDKISEVKTDSASEIIDLTLALFDMCRDNLKEHGFVNNINSLWKAIQYTQHYACVFMRKCDVEEVEIARFNENIASDVQHAVNMASIGNEAYKYMHDSTNARDRATEEFKGYVALMEKAIEIGTDNKAILIKRYKDLISLKRSLRNCYYGNEMKEFVNNEIRAVEKLIIELDPSYANQQSSASSGGCYVATAVYGSYDCPQVWTLRRFRDYTLAETWYGRAFIRTYYAISPTLVKWFGHTEWFKNMWKGKLDRMVANLNANGVENTPYEDRNW